MVGELRWTSHGSVLAPRFSLDAQFYALTDPPDVDKMYAVVWFDEDSRCYTWSTAQAVGTGFKLLADAMVMAEKYVATHPGLPPLGQGPQFGDKDHVDQ